jgi:hypothetical protein
MNITKLITGNQLLFLKTNTRILVKLKIKQYLSTLHEANQLQKTTRSDNYYKSNEFTSKYSNLFIAVQKKTNLDDKESSLIYLHIIFKAFQTLIEKKGASDDEIISSWRTMVKNEQYLDLNFLLNYIVRHKDFNKSIDFILKNLSEFNRKELAFIFKIHTNLIDNKGKSELTIAIKDSLKIDSEQELRNFDSFDLNNIYSAYSALNLKEELFEQTYQYVYENHLMQFDKELNKFNSEILDKEIIDKNLYYHFDFETKRFLWSKLNLFSVYKKQYLRDERIDFLNEYFQHLNEVLDQEEVVKNSSFKTYKINLLSFFYKELNEAIQIKFIRNNHNLNVKLQKNFNKYQDEFLKNLKLIENNDSLNKSIRLFTIIDDHFLSKDYKIALDFFKNILLNPKTESFQFFSFLRYYHDLLKEKFMNRNHFQTFQKIKNLNLLPSSMVNTIYNDLVTITIDQNQQFIDAYLKNIKNSDYFDLRNVECTFSFIYNIAANINQKAGLEFIDNIYDFIIDLIEREDMALKHVIPTLNALMLIRREAKVYTVEKHLKLSEIIIDFLKNKNLELEPSHYFLLITFLTSEKLSINKHFNDVHDLLVKRAIDYYSVDRFSTIIFCIIRNLNKEFIGNSKYQLISFSSDFVKKFTISMHKGYYAKGDNFEINSLLNASRNICELDTSLLEYLDRSDSDAYDEFRLKLSENIDNINVKYLISKANSPLNYKIDKKNSCSLELRMGKLAKMIILTNTFLFNDFGVIWNYLFKYIGDLIASNEILRNPNVENLIDLLSLFKHFDYTNDENYLNKRLDIFKNLMSKLYSRLDTYDISNELMLTLAECLLSLNFFDKKLFNDILSKKFEISLDVSFFFFGKN